MKVGKLFYGMFAASALFCACSSDDALTSSSNTSSSGTTTAYMAVQLNDVGSSGTRATSTGYQDGLESEYAIASAYFYFYDAEGKLMTQSSYGSLTGSTSEDENIDYNVPKMIVLDNLTEATFPKYMVTILNKPDAFTASYVGTLGQISSAWSNPSYPGIQDYAGNFVMSTSSYNGASSNESWYFVNELSDNNFYTQDTELASISDEDVVDVYVERLAAKVTVNVGSTLTATGTTVNGETLYSVAATTEQIADGASLPTYNENATVYVKLNGWKLNGTTKRTRMIKTIDTHWRDADLGFTWNDANYHRSYWGETYNYGLGSSDFVYPANYKTYAAYTTTETGADGTKVLNYVNYNALTNTFGGIEYCPGNTNTSTIVTANFPSSVTSVLVSATICDENGNAVDDMVSYGGVLFTKADYLKYVLYQVNQKGGLNAYYGTETTTSDGASAMQYTQISESDVEYKNLLDGYVAVTLTSTAQSATNLYYIDETTGAYVAMTSDKLQEVIDALEGFTDEAVYYLGGEMYYDIPIEHLNNTEETKDADGNVTYVPEARYGVVRNHYYNLTINSLETLGKGIFDPAEEIIPNEDLLERYKISATINVLTWKLVNQDVDL